MNELVEKILAIINYKIEDDSIDELELLRIKLDQIDRIAKDEMVEDDTPRVLCFELIRALPSDKLTEAYESLATIANTLDV